MARASKKVLVKYNNNNLPYKEKIEYLIDINNNNNKIYKNKEKKILYGYIWQKIFEIPPEENRHFD